MRQSLSDEEFEKSENSVLPGIQCGITFIYFQDYEKACIDLKDRFGFVPRTDFGYAQMFEICKDYFICAVKMSEVSKTFQSEKSVTLCFTAPSFEALHEWHRKLNVKGVLTTSLEKSKQLEYYAFKAVGPEGYSFEFGFFLKPEEAQYYNPTVLEDREVD